MAFNSFDDLLWFVVCIVVSHTTVDLLTVKEVLD